MSPLKVPPIIQLAAGMVQVRVDGLRARVHDEAARHKIQVALLDWPLFSICWG